MRKLACFCDGVMELELEEGGAGGAELLRGMLKKIFFVPVVVTNRDKRVSFVPVARPGTKDHPFCPGLALPVGKPGQQGFPNRNKSTFFSSGSPCVSLSLKKNRWPVWLAS